MKQKETPVNLELTNVERRGLLIRQEALTLAAREGGAPTAIIEAAKLYEAYLLGAEIMAAPVTVQVLPIGKPAVPINESIQPDYLICLETGHRFKSLKRHLQAHFNLTPAAYRQRWNLPADYPMVAPHYAKQRRDLAIAMGLGRKNR